jgi:hypothetical protein
MFSSDSSLSEGADSRLNQSFDKKIKLLDNQALHEFGPGGQPRKCIVSNCSFTTA